MIIEKKYHFYAAHRNKNAGEKCGRIHGHTYNVVCYFEFNEMEDGITMLFSEIDSLLEPIVKTYDHYFILNEADPLVELLEAVSEPFIKLPFDTSAENMAMWLHTRIVNETGLPLKRIEVAETKSSNVIYEK